MLETEPEAFNCTTCVVSKALKELDEDNTDAWNLFQTACDRFGIETQTVAMRLERATAGLSHEQFEDTMARLAILYDAYYPARKPHGA